MSGLNLRSLNIRPGSVLVVRPDGSGGFTATHVPAEFVRPTEPKPEPAVAPEIQRILDRFAHRNPDVLAVYRGAIDRGWTGHAPEPHVQASNEEYVRVQYRGWEHRVSLYLNSAYFECAGVKIAPFAATLPGVDVRSNGNVYIRYDGHGDQSVAAAIDHLDRLKAFANGNAADVY